MSGQANGEFTVTAWEESPLDDFGEGGGRLTRARLEQTYAGDITGSAVSEWLMAYRADGTADFVGHQTLRGQLEGRDGVLVLEVVGHFDGRTSWGDLTAVTGCGSGALADLKGAGRFSAELGPTGTWDLEYAFIDRTPA